MPLNEHNNKKKQQQKMKKKKILKKMEIDAGGNSEDLNDEVIEVDEKLIEEESDHEGEGKSFFFNFEENRM